MVRFAPKQADMEILVAAPSNVNVFTQTPLS